MVPQAAGWDQGVRDAWASVIQSVPKIGAFVLIVLAGGLAARGIVSAVNRLLVRAGTDNLLDRSGLPRALRRPAADLRTGLMRITFAIAALAFLQLALGVFGANPVSSLISDLAVLLAHTVLACVVLVIGATLASTARRYVGSALSGLPYAGTAGGISAAIIMIGFGKAALDELGLATSVTTPMLYAVLATVTGVTIVGVGGGLIRPMQQRWEEVLRRGGQELASARSTWQGNRARSAAEEPMLVAVSDLVASGRTGRRPGTPREPLPPQHDAGEPGGHAEPTRQP
ncbi:MULTISPECIES: mechanosensitive ion channel family protein [unclassified Frankia]|uniref:mechanosensitive ion channel family protein n=1 Tax=unclassified Frankia TaxID=2632575 RepID=UPI002025A003